MRRIITACVLSVVFLFAGSAFAEDGKKECPKAKSQAQKCPVKKEAQKAHHKHHGQKAHHGHKHGQKGPSAAQREEFMKKVAAKKAEFMKKFDKNSDGKIDDKEKTAIKEAFKAQREAFMKKFDKDSDGKLSDEEKAAIRKAFQKRRPGHRGPPPKK